MKLSGIGEGAKKREGEERRGAVQEGKGTKIKEVLEEFNQSHIKDVK